MLVARHIQLVILIGWFLPLLNIVKTERSQTLNAEYSFFFPLNSVVKHTGAAFGTHRLTLLLRGKHNSYF